MSMEIGEHPPKPRLVLRVGVTGKRAIESSDQKTIRSNLEDVFGALADFLVACRNKHPDVFDDRRRPLLRIISGMAEGADQLAAKIADERFGSESDVETRLAAILPFEKTEYESDFLFDPNKPNSPKGNNKRGDTEWRRKVKDFNGLLEKEVVESVLQIDDEAILNTPNPGDRNQAYVNLRDLLVEHADVLVAVSDDVDGGEGGTVDVIRYALQAGVPVLVISTVDHSIYMPKTPDPDAPDRKQVKKPDDNHYLTTSSSVLPRSFMRQLWRTLSPPFEFSSAGSSAGSHKAADLDHEEHRSGRKRLDEYLKEQFALPTFVWVYKAARAAITAWPIGYRNSRLVAGWRAFWPARTGYDRRTPAKIVDELTKNWSGPSTADMKNEHFAKTHALRFAWADALAVRYADSTRSSYVAIASWGAAAVFVGLLAVLFPDPYAAPAKFVLLICEGLILRKAANHYFLPAHEDAWHEKMVEYRVLAELLRHQRFVYAFGSAGRLARSGDRMWRDADAWIGWYVRATLRELGFPRTRLCINYRREALTAFHKQEVEDQVAYNKREAERFALIDERLAWNIRRAWRGVAWTAFAGAGVIFILWPIEIANSYGHAQAETALHIIKPLLTIALAFVPAAIAAVHGVRSQMEFENSAKRFKDTYRQLRAIRLQVSCFLRPKERVLGRQACLSFVGAANNAMAADVAGWSTVFKTKAAEPPG